MPYSEGRAPDYESGGRLPVHVPCYAWHMDTTLTTLERAFQLARSGDCVSVADIKKQLSTEGYSAAQVSGPTLTKQLAALIREARAQRPLP